MDIWSRDKRSEVMGKVKCKDTKPELIVRRFLFHKGYRYRKNDIRLPGTPDVVLKKCRVVVFVNGCFWHGHEVDGRLPRSNVQFWEAKIKRNKERDYENKKKLLQMGWGVITIWECQLKPKVVIRTLQSLDYLLNKRFLDTYRIRLSNPYAREEPEEIPIVAESRNDFRKNKG